MPSTPKGSADCHELEKCWNAIEARREVKKAELKNTEELNALRLVSANYANEINEQVNVKKLIGQFEELKTTDCIKEKKVDVPELRKKYECNKNDTPSSNLKKHNMFEQNKPTNSPGNLNIMKRIFEESDHRKYPGNMQNKINIFEEKESEA